ncbi:IclR family transcriptional regulator [Geomicrobium sediminis]|uniref:DNA-binding IclR family transcriptional regulator n=2 Tax=Geomicrobium TaxID=767528 RepID=A0ABS2PH73_9BACL|nr:IclR family transcriptional regulator [Geomicrobium sediminis]MBM7634390.1 DNA-binding IclR family transcriptional regulator [Geomicrobium sediminis]
MLQSIDRAMRVLDLLKEHHFGLGVTELSHRLGVAKSTVHRIVSSLEAHGYVKQEPGNGNYRLGLKFLEMQQYVLKQMEITSIARPFLDELSREANEIVHLVEQQDYEVVYLDKVEQHSNTIRIYSRVGRRAPMHCTGVGKVLLSHFSEAKLEQYFQQVPNRQKYTDYTVTTEKEIKHAITRIKGAGYSIDNEEHERGIRCVAAPVYNHVGEVNYGVSVTGPLDRMDDNKVKHVVELLTNSCRQISKELGHH